VERKFYDLELISMVAAYGKDTDVDYLILLGYH
jgi:hypothetical protein